MPVEPDSNVIVLVNELCSLLVSILPLAISHSGWPALLVGIEFTFNGTLFHGTEMFKPMKSLRFI